MGQVVTLYWRDIPAQVVAEKGRGRKREQAKIELHRRFALAIDEAAMRDGADSTDDYLADWRRGCLLYTSPSPRDGLLSRMPSSA